jgi:cytochrome c oxidase subunit 2
VSKADFEQWLTTQQDEAKAAKAAAQTAQTAPAPANQG